MKSYFSALIFTCFIYCADAQPVRHDTLRIITTTLTLCKENATIDSLMHVVIQHSSLADSCFLMDVSGGKDYYLQLFQMKRNWFGMPQVLGVNHNIWGYFKYLNFTIFIQGGFANDPYNFFTVLKKNKVFTLDWKYLNFSNDDYLFFAYFKYENGRFSSALHASY
jgi:hypothetical protein